MRPLPQAIISALAFSSAVFAADDNTWMRLPEATAPLMKDAPQIDGTIDAREWLDAARVGLLAVDSPGTSDGLQRRLYLGYDKERIYLAVQIERPSNALIPKSPVQPGRVDTSRGGDTVEFSFTPGREREKAVTFVLYANGAFADALSSGGKDFTWNAPGTKAAARLTDTGWEGELSIPFADLGLSGPPSPTDIWGFDAVDNRTTPSVRLAHWSYRGGIWRNVDNYGILRFAPVPAVRLAEAGQIGVGRLGLGFSVVNATAAAQPIKTTIRLLKRKHGADGGLKAFLENIESGMGHDAQAEFTKGVKLPDQILFALGFYEPIGEPVVEQATIPVGEQRTFGVNQTADLGEYLMLYEVATGTTPLARGSIVVPLRPNLPLHIEPYWLYTQVIDIVIEDTSRLTPPPGSIAKTRIFQPAAPDKTLSEAQISVPENATTFILPLDVKGLVPGGYRIETSITAPDGKQLAAITTDLERPAPPPWFKNDFGNQLKVPKPWIPLEASGDGIVRMWNRTYDLSTFLPRSVLSGGAEILAAPVTLDVTIDGAKQTFRVDSLKLTENQPNQAIYAASLSSDKATLKGTVTVGYDGFTWYDVTLSPKSPGGTLDSIALAARVQPAFSELFGRHKFLEDPAFPAPVPEKNSQPGIVQHSFMPFTPLLWIGKETGGLIVSLEGMKDWSVDRPNAVMETIPSEKGAPSAMLVHMVQKPVPFDAPRTFGFSLQGTPIREAMKDYRNLFIQQSLGVFDDEEQIKKNAEAGVRVMVFYYSWRGDAKTELGGTPERPVLPGQSEKLKRAVELVHKYGMKAIVYTGWGVNAVSPNWQKFGYELGKYPISNKGWGTYEQVPGLTGGYVDYMAYGHADLAKEYGIDGVLYDSVMNLTPDSNLRAGNGWVDAQGQVHPTYPVRATRELARRIYTIYEGEVRPPGQGFIYNHVGSMWNANIFADVINRGEGRPMTAPTLRQAWVPLEEYRAEYSGEPFGVVQSNEQNDQKKLPMSVNNHSAVSLLHGTFPKVGSVGKPDSKGSYERYRRPSRQQWDAWSWLPMDGTQTRFIYFENQKAVLPENPKLLSSAFVSADKKRAIIVVSNLDKEVLTKQNVKLDFHALGMAPGPYKVEDVVTEEIVPLEGDTVSLDILDERFRLLRITAAQP